MFSRRHPILFFMLAVGVMATLCVLVISITVMLVGSADSYGSGEKIGVIEITGPIVDGRPIIEAIKRFRENDAIKAMVVRIDSPGGGVGPSQEIYREIRRTIEQKKVIASMGAVAASGGIYVASAADGIVANPGTLTGSIGVIMGYTNLEEVIRKIGISPVVIKSGQYKDIGSPMRSMTAEERSLLESLTQDIHRQFVADVAQGRHLEVTQVEAIADGRVFSGQQAHTLGLVDRLGNFQDAVLWASELAGIQDEPELVYPEKKRLPLLRYLMESALQLWTESRSGAGLVPQARM